MAKVKTLLWPKEGINMTPMFGGSPLPRVGEVTHAQSQVASISERFNITAEQAAASGPMSDVCSTCRADSQKLT